MVSLAPDDRLDDRYLVQPVLKAMQVLQLVCEAPEPVSLNQLVRDAALPKTTVFRYLRTLATLGFVEHNAEADRYRPGIGLWRLSHSSSPYETLRQAGKPHMKRLRQRFNETINLGVLSGGEVVYLDVLESERSLRMQSSVGATDPLHSTALGKVFLAFRPPSQRAMLDSAGAAQAHEEHDHRPRRAPRPARDHPHHGLCDRDRRERGRLLLHRRPDPRPARRGDRGDEPVGADLALRREFSSGDLRRAHHRLRRDRPDAPRRGRRAGRGGGESRRLSPEPATRDRRFPLTIAA